MNNEGARNSHKRIYKSRAEQSGRQGRQKDLRQLVKQSIRVSPPSDILLVHK